MEQLKQPAPTAGDSPPPPPTSTSLASLPAPRDDRGEDESKDKGGIHTSYLVLAGVFVAGVVGGLAAGIDPMTVFGAVPVITGGVGAFVASIRRRR